MTCPGDHYRLLPSTDNRSQGQSDVQGLGRRQATSARPATQRIRRIKSEGFGYVIKINGDGNDMDPESLLHACIDKVDTIELTLQRDLGNNMYRIERECNCLCS